MDRRTLLRAGAAAGAAALAGCSGLFESRQTSVPPVPEDRPDGVYIPSHVEGMNVVGTKRAGDYAFGLTYSYPHRFWNVNGDAVSLTEMRPEDDVHLMAVVWDPETGTVLPDTGLSVAISRDGSLVSQEAIYPMLSQPMGFHYGANFGLDGDGEYAVELSVGAMSTRRSGSFAERFTEPTRVEVPFEYSEQAKNEISFETMEAAGNAGAVEPMRMEMLPASTALTPEDLPGTVVGTATSNDAKLVVTVLDRPPEGIGGDGSYLAVSARTPYNGMVIPAMGLQGSLTCGGSTAFEGELVRTLDPDLGYHYGAVVDAVETSDELTLSPTVQPQTARHEGYETAFGGLLGPMTEASVTVE